MRKQFKGNICFILAMLFTAIMISACSSEKVEETPKQEVQEEVADKQEVQQEEVKEEVVEEQLIVESKPSVESESETKSEPELESEYEPEPEPESEPEKPLEPEENLDSIIENIDMESDLPGREWVDTFVDVVEEPVFVVFNDETNKKVVALDGQAIQYENGDTFVVYTPKDIYVDSYSGAPVQERSTESGYYTEFIFYLEFMQEKQNFAIYLTQGDEGRFITATVKYKP